MLKGKVILITGANGGIGRAMVEAFAKNGAEVWANVRNINQDFSEYCKNLTIKYETKIFPIIFDVTDFDAVRSAVMEIKKTSGKIDVLVNNAGILKEALLQMTSMDVARKMFDVNFFAAFYLSQMVSKLMVRQKDGGSIVNISSVAALDGVEGQTIYGATKAALYSMTKSMAKELGKYKIRANCIAPGVTETALIADMKTDVLEHEAEVSYLKRLGQPQDIAKVAVFLASDDAQYITGQILRVDGGRN